MTGQIAAAPAVKMAAVRTMARPTEKRTRYRRLGHPRPRASVEGVECFTDSPFVQDCGMVVLQTVPASSGAVFASIVTLAFQLTFVSPPPRSGRQVLGRRPCQ